MFEAIRKAGLVINLGKCEFAQAQVTYLGHKVGNGKVLPKKSKIEAILAFPSPRTKKAVRQFLGMCGFYRKFVPRYSEITFSLTELLKGKSNFAWSADCELAFNKLKAILSSSPILKSPDFNKPFLLMTDASDFGVGAVLMQEDDLQNQLPIAYFSKKLNESQRKYSTVEKETLALLLSLRHFEVYATSGVTPLKVFSDHNPIKFLQRFGNKNRRLANWSLILQEYNFDIEHIKGKDNVIADSLSRNFESY